METALAGPCAGRRLKVRVEEIHCTEAQLAALWPEAARLGCVLVVRMRAGHVERYRPPDPTSDCDRVLMRSTSGTATAFAHNRTPPFMRRSNKEV